MKTLHLTVVVVLLLATQVFSNDEKPKTSMAKRDVYYPSNYPSNYPPNYPDSYECKSPPTCLAAGSIPNQDAEAPADGWITNTRLFYVTMETCWGYTSFANMLLGRKIFSYSELVAMCLSTFLGNETTVQTYSGFGKQIYQECSLPTADTAVNNCSNTAGDPGTDTTLQVYETDYAVLSDGMSWVVYYRCVDGRYGDFQLYSTRPYLEQSVLTDVLAFAITQLKFSATDIKVLQCMSPTYPVPFQNYPEPDPGLSKSCSYPSSYSPPSQPLASNPPHNYPHSYHPM